MPGRGGDKWPTEIPASLYLGGSSDGIYPSNVDLRYRLNDTLEAFLSVKTYFKVSLHPTDIPRWYLVTPLLQGGNLNTLAKKLLKSSEAKSVRELDAWFRPAFNRLLESMEELHRSGYCHDDIKPANIFIKNDHHWLLGDLGNVRHITHPYHSSKLWRDNQQLKDCRSNDVIRALKVYLEFIQSSVVDRNGFNTAFFEAKEPLSRLFWWTLRNAQNMSAVELHRRSLLEHPEALSSISLDTAVDLQAFGRRPIAISTWQSALDRAADRALATRIGEKRTRFWALVWLFGVPVPNTC